MLSPNTSERPSSRVSLSSPTGQNSSIKVAVRVRPPKKDKRESLSNTELDTQASMSTNTIFLPSFNQRFFFDNVFEHSVEQQQIYESTVSPMISTFLDGFNVTVLAYGQTSSGKTYTIGTAGATDSSSEGIIPRAVRAIFEECSQIDSTQNNITLNVAYLELYNEELIDLLNDGQSAKQDVVIREDKGRIIWSGVKEVSVSSAQDVWNLLQEGSTRRRVAATDMNQVSSRSHAIFSISLSRTRINKNSTKTLIKSKFHFVDLAGSERMKKTGALGDRAKEGININSGLSALGNVISALANPEMNPHIPYRNSKLTRLLQDSIGGNSYTIMIACVSPGYSDANETQNTLKYASRARNIKSKVVQIQEDITDVSTLKSIIRRLEDEVDALKSGSGIVSPTSQPKNDLHTFFLVKKNKTLEADMAKLQNSYNALKLKLNSYSLATLSKDDLSIKSPFNEGTSAISDTTANSEMHKLIGPIIEEYESTLKTLEKKLNLTQKNYLDQRKELEDTLTELINSETSNVEKSQNINELNDQLEELKKKNQDLNDLSETVTKLFDPIFTVKDNTPNLNKLLVASPESRDALLKELSSQIISFHSERESLVLNVKKLTKENSNLRKDVNMLSKSVSLPTEPIEPLKSKPLDLKNILEDSSFSDTPSTNQENFVVTDTLSSLNSDIVSDSSYFELKKKYDQMQIEMDALKSQLSHYTMSDAKKDTAIIKLEEELLALESNKTLCIDEADTKAKVSRDVSNGLNDDANIQDYEETKLNLMKEVADLQHTLASKSDTLVDAEFKIKNMEYENNELVSKLENNDVLHKEEILELTKKVEALEEKLGSGDLKSKIKEMEDVNNELSLQLKAGKESHKEQIQKLTDKIKDLEVKLSTLEVQQSHERSVMDNTNGVDSELESDSKSDFTLKIEQEKPEENLISELSLKEEKIKELEEIFNLQRIEFQKLLSAKKVDEEALKKKEEEFDSLVEEYQEQYKNIQLELKMTKEFSDYLKEELENVLNEIKIKNEELKSLKEEIMEHKEGLSIIPQKDNKIESLSSELILLNDTIKSREVDISNASLKNDELLNEFNKQQEDVEYLRNKLNETNKELEVLRLKNQEDSDALEESKKSLEEIEANMDKEIQSLKASSDEIQKSYEDKLLESTEEINRLKGLCAESESRAKELEGIKSELTMALKELGKQKELINYYEIEKETVKLELQSLADSSNTLSHYELRSKDNTSNFGNELNKEINGKNENKKTSFISNANTYTNEELESVLAENDELKAKIEILIIEIEASNELNVELETNLECLKQELNSSNELLSVFEAELQKADKAKDLYLAQINKVKKDNELYLAQVEKVNKEKDLCLAQIDKNNEDIEHYINQINDLKSLISENQNKISQLSQALEDERKNHETQVNSLKIEHDTLTRKQSMIINSLRPLSHDSSGSIKAPSTKQSISPANSIKGGISKNKKKFMCI